MKIGEILELTQTMNIATIAKQIDGISEKPLRALLRKVGCVHHAGKKGWEYEGDDPDILGRSIFDFKTPKANNNKKASKNDNSRDIIKNVDSNTTKVNKEVNDMKAEIVDLLNGIEPNKPVKRFKGFYLDEDIANILDRIKHGNKSDLVNKIIRQYLMDNDLL